MKGRVLVIDQGTTSTRAIVFGADFMPIAMAQQEFAQIFPRRGMGRAQSGRHLAKRAGYRARGAA